MLFHIFAAHFSDGEISDLGNIDASWRVAGRFADGCGTLAEAKLQRKNCVIIASFDYQSL